MESCIQSDGGILNKDYQKKVKKSSELLQCFKMLRQSVQKGHGLYPILIYAKMSFVSKLDQKPPKESAAEMIQVVLPNDANPLGNILGGRVMHWIDLVGAVVASRHSRRPVVTASMERLDFHSPIRVGYIVLLKGSLHYVGRTSMEVGVEVYSEDPMTGQRTHTSSAILTYVALDDDGKPTSVPKLKLETDEEKRRFRTAEERRLKRMQER